MNTEEIDYSNLTPDTILDIANKERLIMLGDEKLSPKLRLATLNGLAQTAVMVKRIASEANSAAADREIAVALSNTLKTLPGNPFLVSNGGPIPLGVLNPPLPEITLVYQETSTDLHVLDLDEIISSS